MFIFFDIHVRVKTLKVGADVLKESGSGPLRIPTTTLSVIAQITPIRCPPSTVKHGGEQDRIQIMRVGVEGRKTEYPHMFLRAFKRDENHRLLELVLKRLVPNHEHAI
jgi:hypothetical protein